MIPYRTEMCFGVPVTLDSLASLLHHRLLALAAEYDCRFDLEGARIMCDPVEPVASVWWLTVRSDMRPEDAALYDLYPCH